MTINFSSAKGLITFQMSLSTSTGRGILTIACHQNLIQKNLSILICVIATSNNCGKLKRYILLGYRFLKILSSFSTDCLYFTEHRKSKMGRPQSFKRLAELIRFVQGQKSWTTGSWKLYEFGCVGLINRTDEQTYLLEPQRVHKPRESSRGNQLKISEDSDPQWLLKPSKVSNHIRKYWISLFGRLGNRTSRWTNRVSLQSYFTEPQELPQHSDCLHNAWGE